MIHHPPGGRLLAALFVLLLVAPAALVEAQITEPTAPTGRLVSFPLTRFNDTLYAAIDTAYRVAFDERGHLWYSTQAGVVHVDVTANKRDLYTRLDGLPSSYTLGLAVLGDKVYAGTELGLAIIDTETGEVTSKTTENSPLADAIVQEVVADGDRLWIGTYFGGVGVWNLTSDTWSFKNTSTTANYPQPIRRIATTTDAVWIATDGDGLWKYDRATGNYSVLLKDDGLVSNQVRAVLPTGANLWIGTDAGLQVRRAYAPYAGTPAEWTLFNTSNSKLPDNFVYDIDAIPTEAGTRDIFASTREGLWQYDGQNDTVRDQDFGILGSFILDNQFTAYGWALATNRGVSLQRGGNWSYFTTGPSSTTVPSNGPHTFLFTSASVGEAGPLLWFGGASGITGYRPPEGDRLGQWFNRAEWSRYPGGPVNFIDTQGDITWVASNTGTFGYKHSTQEWLERKVTNSRNLVYGIEADRGELWIALFGDGLIMRNLTTGITRSWDYSSIAPVPDQFLTDVRAQGNDIWLGASIGVIRMDRVAGTFAATYTVADGIPGSGVVFRTLPEGQNVWIATKDGGVARLDVGAGRVTQVWNATTTPGFPNVEVRSIHREGNHLWAGTTDGLVRIDLQTGAIKVYRASDSGLVQNYVNGITSRDGVLYLATLSGVARLDIAADDFLPMHEGPGIAKPRADAPRAPLTSPLRVGITSPRELELVAGLFDIAGTAQRASGAVDRVEVQIGDGPWLPAEGTSSWRYVWDSSTATPDETLVIRARAFSGTSVSRVAEVLAIPVRPPTTPLEVEALSPPNATAGRPLTLAARIVGDEPLTTNAYYKVGNATTFTRLPLVKSGAIYTAIVPARDVLEGSFAFYIEGRSGQQLLTDPTDPSEPYILTVDPAPLLAVTLAAPSSIDARAGETTSITLIVKNTGTQPVVVQMAATGKRPDWIKLPSEAVTLAPGESRTLAANAQVPREAFADTWNVTFEARDASGVADPATAIVPLRILEAAPVTTPTGGVDEGPKGFIPAPAAGLVVLAVAAVALALGRRRP